MNTTGRKAFYVLTPFLALMLLATSRNTQAQTTAPRFEVTHYSIYSDLFPTTHLLKARAKIDFVPQVGMSSIGFELHGALKVSSVVDSTRKNLNYRQDGLNLNVDFQSALQPSQSTSITVEWRNAGQRGRQSGGKLEARLCGPGRILPALSCPLVSSEWIWSESFCRHHADFCAARRNRNCVRNRGLNRPPGRQSNLHISI